jgi:DNA-binding CsgD family transcriptional regulator
MIACRDWARINRQSGVWGAETDEERADAISASEALLAPAVERNRPDCGTPAGSMWHRRYDPDGPCSRCKQAACDADRERRQRRKKEIAAQWPPQLAPREQTVLEHLAAGLTRKDMAQAMGVQRKTIDVNVTRLRAKLRVFEVDDLLRVARELSLIGPVARELVAA